MALFDNSGLAGLAGLSGAAQNGGFVNPQDNLSNRLAALAKAFQGAGTPQQAQGQQQQFMPPQALAGAPVTHPMQQQPVDFSRGPTPGNSSGY